MICVHMIPRKEYRVEHELEFFLRFGSPDILQSIYQ